MEYNQQERSKENKKWWDRLNYAAAQKDVRSFWNIYRQYLEWAGIHSTRRKMLYDMIIITQNHIDDHLG